MGKFYTLIFFKFIQGNNQPVPVKTEADSGETVKGADTKLSSSRRSQRASPEGACSEKQDTPSPEVCIPLSLLLKRAVLTGRQRAQISPISRCLLCR